MEVVLGLIVAAGFGSGDFLGGLASRRTATLAVLAVSQLAAFAGALIVVGVTGGSVHGTALAYGAVAGLLNLAAVGCLYRGLAIGQMGQVAPIAAVIGSFIPVVYGFARGERPGVPSMVGIALAIVAAAMLSSEREERRGPLFGRALALSAAAGIGFGVALVLFSIASRSGTLWPVLSARSVALVAAWAVLWLTGGSSALAGVPKAQASFAGILDVGATTLLLVALRGGLTVVVAPIASLAPGFTAAHARWYLHERISRVQMVGVVLALVGLGLIAAG